jgi:hypothetical protein
VLLIAGLGTAEKVGFRVGTKNYEIFGTTWTLPRVYLDLYRLEFYK